MRIRLSLALCATLLLGAPGAANATVENIVPSFGSPPASSTTAGDFVNYRIDFTVPNGLTGGAGAYIEIDASTGAPGTIFPPGPPAQDPDPHQSLYRVVTQTGSVDPAAPVVLSNSGQTVRIPLDDTALSVPPGGTVSVRIGFQGDRVRNPLVPGTYTLQVSTHLDAAGTSSPYEVVEGPGDFTGEGGSGQTATVGQAFAQPLEVKLVDGLGAPVEGAEILFEAPAAGPSGTFTGGDDGGRTLTVTTDANGEASSSVLTANGVAGSWDVTATVVGNDDLDPVTFELTNDADIPSEIELTLTPPTIQGNGVSVSVARAKVTDSFGNVITGHDVTFASDGAQEVDDQGEAATGVHTALITSTPVAGVFEITATDTTTDPDLVDTASLTQTADEKGPGTSITGKPAQRTKKKRVRFEFLSNNQDVDFFECRLDDRSWSECGSPESYRVSVGNHTFRVRAVDHAGNKGPVETDSFKRLRD
jgi:hypothetical protein